MDALDGAPAAFLEKPVRHGELLREPIDSALTEDQGSCRRPSYLLTERLLSPMGATVIWLSLFARLGSFCIGLAEDVRVNAPLFGVLAGVLLLREPLTPSFAAAAALVGAGIYLVNLKA